MKAALLPRKKKDVFMPEITEVSSLLNQAVKGRYHNGAIIPEKSASSEISKVGLECPKMAF